MLGNNVREAGSDGDFRSRRSSRVHYVWHRDSKTGNAILEQQPHERLEIDTTGGLPYIS